ANASTPWPSPLKPCRPSSSFTWAARRSQRLPKWQGQLAATARGALPPRSLGERVGVRGGLLFFSFHPHPYRPENETPVPKKRKAPLTNRTRVSEHECRDGITPIAFRCGDGGKPGYGSSTYQKLLPGSSTSMSHA